MNKRLNVRKTHKMFINGKFVRSESERTYNWNSKQIKTSINICQASRKDFRDAIISAKNAFPSWKSKTAYNRAQIIYRCAEIIEGRSPQLIEELVLQGISQSKAVTEVKQTIDTLVYFAGWADKYNQIFSTVNPVSSPYFSFSVLEPTGIIVIIPSEKSGLLGILGGIIPTIIGGNTCVTLMPQDYPLCAASLAESLHSSDVPPGVVNIITGFQSELLEHFATHMEVNGLIYFGENIDTITAIEQNASQNLKRVSICHDKDWMYNDSLHPYSILRTQETKTTWHPIGY